MSYLFEPTMAEALPDTLTVNGSTFTKGTTDTLTDGTNTTMAWADYSDGSTWVVRLVRPDDPAAPTAWLYDQIAEADANGVTVLDWCMACIVTASTLWNE